MYSLRKSHPLMKPLSQSLMDLPAPVNISLLWNYGSLLGMFLMIQLITGILLSMHYSSDINLAFSSLIHITCNVNWGWLMHSAHMNGASLFMLFMYIHMARGLYFNSYSMKETWNIGVTIFILAMATAFMGYVLPWGQMSFWGATVITNIFSAVPYLGKTLVEWLWGSFTVSGPTLGRFFIMHFLLPFIITIMVVLHLIMLHQSASNNPLGVNSNSDRTPFHYYFTTKDLMGMLLIMSLFIMILMINPNFLSDPENFMEAMSMMMPTHIQPEWYFLWLYAILRSIPNKLGGVIALLLAIFILYMPTMYHSLKLSSSFYPISQFMFYMMLMAWLILSWIGSCPVEVPFIKIGQMFSIIYFFYFLMVPQDMQSSFQPKKWAGKK